MGGRERLQGILNPAKVAWFGGGGLAPALRYMQANGFSGSAVAVHPKRTEIAGVRCVPSAEDLPWVPDLSVLVIPKEAVIDTVRILSRMGCGAAICITSGFSESGGGADWQAALVAAAADMPLIGPNCPGIANFLDGNAFMMDHFGDHGGETGAAVISAGGAYLSDLGCADRSQPIAYMIGLGNQAAVSVADMMDAVLDDTRVMSINVYLEGMGDVAKLSRAAAKAARKGIPVVAIKGGRSEAGRRATQTHTASLAGDSAIASALFRRFGWIEVRTPSEAIETLKMLSYTPIPDGVGAGLVTSSGSYAVLGGDIAEKAGLRMDPPDPATSAEIGAALPPYVGPANPLDISDAHGWPQEDQLAIYRAFARNGFDLFVQVMCYPPEGGWDMSTWDATTDALAEAKGDRPAAFVNTLAESLPRHARERMIAQGMAPLQGIEDGLRAVAHAALYGSRRGSFRPDAMLLDGPIAAPGRRRETLGEADAKHRLGQAGLDVPRQWRAHDLGELPEPPCVCALKAIVPGVLHKSEAGAVDLNIAPEDLPDAIRAMAGRLKARKLVPEGYLIEEMVASPVAELLVGARRVPEVGLALTLAMGGIAVGLAKDAATLILPAPRKEIEAALMGLDLAPLICGYRGRPRADLACALDAIEAVCSLVRSDPSIIELEINPLLLTEDRAVIADAVLTISPEETS